VGGTAFLLLPATPEEPLHEILMTKAAKLL